MSEDIVHDPGGLGFEIEAIWAFLAVHDEDGDEGVISAPAPGGGQMPLIAADQDRLESLRPIAEAIANKTGKDVNLVKFHQREHIETIEPSES